MVRAISGVIRVPLVGQGRANAFFAGIGCEGEQVFTHQWFTTGKEDHWHVKSGKIVNECQSFLCGQFTFIAFAFRIGITMAALQIAGAGAVPAHNRTAPFRNAILGTTARRRIAQIITEIRIAGQ